MSWSRWPRSAVTGALTVSMLAGALTGCGATNRQAAPQRSPAASPAAPAGSSPTAASLAPGATYFGIGLQPAPRKPAFTLTRTDGQPFPLSTATAGMLTYLYFGYTQCPDACPTAMADLALALGRQPAAVRSRVRVVFVTTDPARDTPAVLQAWLAHFDSSFIGLTGTQADIQVAERLAGVPLARPEPVAGGGYSVQHSAELFAYSPDGLSHVVYADGFTSAQYAHDMPLLLQRV
ncbi:MAG: SCO family protein [Actinomycetota bacterium]|nr:SCO family protein [Actinomycetota bacterium]